MKEKSTTKKGGRRTAVAVLFLTGATVFTVGGFSVVNNGFNSRWDFFGETDNGTSRRIDGETPGGDIIDSSGNAGALPPYVNTGSSGTSGPLLDARQMVNPITIPLSQHSLGMIDIGDVNPSYFQSGHIHNTNNYPPYDNHATDVAYVLSSAYGMNPTAHLYVQYASSIDSGFSCLDSSVNRRIANASYYLTGGNYGNYTNGDHFFDCQSAANDYVFVKSAGNYSGDNQEYLTSPGLGLNVISVGSIDLDGNVSYFSSYRRQGTAEANCLKPTLVAPGEGLELTEDDPQNGTSFAAPFVTGALSLLSIHCEGTSASGLIERPEFAQSLLLNSATSVTGYECLWDPYSGGGVLNVMAAAGIIDNGDYWVGSSNNVHNNDVVHTQSLTLPAGKKVDLVLCHKYMAGGTTTYNTNLHTVSVTPYSIIASAPGGISQEFTNVGNVSFGTLYNTGNQAVTYAISIVAKGNNVENGPLQRFALTWLTSDHIHHFNDHYACFSPTKHFAYCPCGASTLTNHVWGHLSSTLVVW